MIRSEIKNFIMSFDKCGVIECTAPATLFSLIKERGEFIYPRSLAEAKSWEGYFDSPCEFSASFIMTDSDVKRKYIYLCFYGLSGEADIYLNGKKLIRADNSNRKWTVDIKGVCLPGKNEIKLVFLPSSGYGRISHQTGSDYGTPIPDVGITGAVELLKFNNAVIDNVSVSETLDGDSATVHISLDTMGNTDSVKAVATLISGAGQVYYGGFSKGQGSIHIRNPLYWWPNGLGVQNIYRLTVNLYGEHDIEDTREYKIGICNLGLNSSPSGAISSANGVSFMPMGAYYTPADDVLHSESDVKISALIMAAAGAGCNTLVVSGSGGLASERLLSACDTYGITVWQELPYCPSGSAIDSDGYKAAIASSLKRMSHHPSLMAVVDAKAYPELGDLELLCKNAAPRLSFMKNEDYMQISMASYPAIVSDKTLMKLVPEGANLLSEEMEWYCMEDCERMLIDTSREYLYAENLSDFAYLTRLTQANKITDYVRGERINRSFGGAAIISRLTDSRPTVSDSMVDYYCVPKAITSYAKTFFAPVFLIPKAEGGNVSFAISNERRQPFVGFVYYRILDAENNVVYHGSDDVNIPEMSVVAIDGRDFTDVISGHEQEYYLEYGLREGALAISKSTLLFVKPKRFAFLDPAFKTHISGVGRSLTMTIEAAAFAKDVEISFRGIDVSLSDNYFDITSPSPIKINLNVMGGASVSSFELEDALSIRCVNTIGKVNKSLKKTRFEAKKKEVLDKLNFDLDATYKLFTESGSN